MRLYAVAEGLSHALVIVSSRSGESHGRGAEARREEDPAAVGCSLHGLVDFLPAPRSPHRIYTHLASYFSPSSFPLSSLPLLPTLAAHEPLQNQASASRAGLVIINHLEQPFVSGAYNERSSRVPIPRDRAGSNVNASSSSDTVHADAIDVAEYEGE